MASDEAKVRVRLDTKGAKAELRGLVRESASAAGRVSSGIRRTVGRGLGVVGLGTGIGAGMAAIRGATESGIGDVVGEALGPVGLWLERRFLGDLAQDARASRSAREEVFQASGPIVGAQNKIPPNLVSYYNQIKSLRLEEEKGRRLIEEDTRFRGPGLDDLVDRIMKGIAQTLKEAADYLISKIPIIGGK